LLKGRVIDIGTKHGGITLNPGAENRLGGFRIMFKLDLVLMIIAGVMLLLLFYVPA
jgi:hypothetical protein